MKRKIVLVVIVILLFVCRYSYAQEQGLYEIKIEQDFEAYNNCKAQGYPYLSDMTITANDIKDSVGTIITHSDKKHTSFFVCTLDSLNETISIKNKITTKQGGFDLNINEIIKTKRDQKELSTEQINFFVTEYSKSL